MNFLKVFVALSLVALACADLYMQNPKGSNNRLDESNTNRNNANRLFDSQNNGKGGYCWAPSMSFYQGSELSIEWTNQHACGNSMVGCHVVIQFMCSPDDADPYNLVRDGSVIGDGANTDRIPFDENDRSQGSTETVTGSAELKYGLHETWMNYKACTTRLRNNGLFVADRNVGNPSNSPARRTRQNNNGNRHGYECPEERDYYPYWHPSKWVDIAYLTGTTEDCEFVRKNSHNVKDQWECMDQDGMPAPPNNEQDCMSEEDEQNRPYQWVKTEKNGFPGPDCAKAPWSRLNHLGNGRNGFANLYNWTIPRVRGRVKCAQGGNDCGFNCVLRMRYNISQADTGSYRVKEGFLDSNFNGDDSPIKNDNIQYQDGLGHQLAMDTSQFARTFQDRSHVFKVLDRPSFLVDTDRIQNLNVRGKRGNIVQTYPATEYDFVPQHLGVRKNDYIHFQWTGCDTNPQGNAGEGTAKTDRSNIVQLADLDKGSVADDEWLESNSKLFPDRETRMMFAYAGQPYDNPEVCHSYERLKEDNNNNNNNIEQDENNCMKLNAANQYFNGGLIKMNNTGTHFIMSSRNNNFTNRGQKGTIYIADILPLWAIVVVAVFGAVFVVSGALFGAMMYARHNEHSQVAQLLNKF